MEFFLITSVILMIASFGIFVIGQDLPIYQRAMIFNSHTFGFVAIIWGFLLPIIPLAILIDLQWYWFIPINFVMMWVVSPWVTKAYLARFSTGKAGKDFVCTLCLSGATLVIGLIIRLT